MSDEMGYNQRKAKCGFCGKILEKGQGSIRIGSISGDKFYVCSFMKLHGCAKDKR